MRRNSQDVPTIHLERLPQRERLVQAKKGYKKLPLLLWLSFLLDVVDVVAFE